MWIPLILFAVACYVYFKTNKRKNYPSGPWRLPIIGNLHQLGLYPEEAFIEMGKVHGPIISIKLGSFEAIVINDYKMIKEALSQNAFKGRMAMDLFIKRSNGKRRGIIQTEGEEHKEHKKFIVKVLHDFGLGKASIDHLINNEIQTLMKTIETDYQNKPVHLEFFFSRAAMNSLMILIFGKRFDQDDPEFLQIIKYLESLLPKVTSIQAAGMVMPWINKISKEWSGLNELLRGYQFVEKFIKAQMKEHAESQIDGQARDLVDAYLEQLKKDKNCESFYKEVGEENAIFTIFDLLFAGIETTSSALQFLFVTLVTYPETQKKIREEIRRVIGNESPSKNDRVNMPYTEGFINEVIRFTTVVSSTGRRTVEDVEFHGFKIPAGTSVLPNFIAAHRDVSAWGDPENFRPERFIGSDGKMKKFDAMIQFGFGKRSCPGEMLSKDTMFIFLTQIVKNFNVLPDPTNPEKPHLKYAKTTFTSFPTYPKLCFAKIKV